jgi:primosomal protein N' (replication factor Y) (superfamily II helicase)
VAVPRLAVDRPFTYTLSEDLHAGTGSLVSVPFHGRTVRGWVLGAARDQPNGRLLPVRKVHSPVRFFDPTMLELLRWVSERYIAPLATVIERSYPPRVAAAEAEGDWAAVDGRTPPARSRSAGGGLPAYVPQLPATPRSAHLEEVLARYGGQGVLGGGSVTWLRPLPKEEVDVCVAAVEACLASGRRALVLLPEADPLPATGKSVLEEFRRRAIGFLGGSGRARYRAWLDLRAGDADVIVATRPGVFVPLPGLGLIWISREVHPGHREDRAPYYHVREVAMARARLARASCVLASLTPTAETAVGVATGAVAVARPPRRTERALAPLVETVAPEAEDRSARLARLLRPARSAALIVSRRGYGVARVCRSCGHQAACSVCSGPIVLERGVARCRVCQALGVCSNCGGSVFGVERGGVERVAEWARRVVRGGVAAEGPEGPPPIGNGVAVGTAASVKDVGPVDLDLVAILDPDRALGRPGIRAGEQALATWMEAAGWASPRSRGGRVLAQTRRPAHPAMQALIRWDPMPFLLSEADRRSRGGFAPLHPVFRVQGRANDGALAEAMARAGADTLLTTAVEGSTVCLVTVHPAKLGAFRHAVMSLAAEGVIARVEAEPHL